MNWSLNDLLELVGKGTKLAICREIVHECHFLFLLCPYDSAAIKLTATFVVGQKLDPPLTQWNLVPFCSKNVMLLEEVPVAKSY